MYKDYMSEEISTVELKAMIANKVKEIGLDDVLDKNAIEKIKNKIMGVYNYEKAKSQVPEVIPEATIPAGMGTSETGIFPGGYGTGVQTGNTSMPDAVSVEKQVGGDFTQQSGQNIDGGTTGNIPAYTPELPSFMDKIEPAKVIVFSQNELSEGGENLTNKPLRTFEDPDVKKSMNDFWMDKGQKKADVYLSKLEKIGELNFDYVNGVTVFKEARFEPDFEAQAKYKENPYMADNAGPAAPGTLDISGQPIINQIATSIDLKQTVEDLVMKILRDQLLTNTERAIGQTEIPIKPVGEFAGNFDTKYTGQMSEVFSIKMIDLVNEYEKIDTPASLKEAIEKNDKKFIVNENEEVQEWVLDGKKYYTPVVKMSIKKCYIK